jgi:hypothetical protein
MASTSETGHAKNIANFNLLSQYCLGYGTRYNPSNPAITTTALDAAYNNAFNLNANLTTLAQPFIRAVNTRQEVFTPVNRLATRIVSAFSVTQGVSPKLVEDANTILRKLRGTRAKKVNPDSEKSISVSQLSFDMRFEHFSELVTMVTSVPTYAPNETDLTPAALNTLRNDLKNTNLRVAQALVALNNARIARNNSLYVGDGSIIALAALTKAYVRSVFGYASPEFKQVNAIRFRLVK